MWGGVQPVPPPPLPPPLPLHHHSPPPLPTTASHPYPHPHPHQACGTCSATSKPPRSSTPRCDAVAISARSAATWWRRRPCAARVTTRVPCPRLLTRVDRPAWATWGTPGLAATAPAQSGHAWLLIELQGRRRVGRLAPRGLGCSEAKAARFPLSTSNQWEHDGTYRCSCGVDRVLQCSSSMTDVPCRPRER